MFSSIEDQMTLEEMIEESGLPNPGELDMPHGSLGGLHGIKFSTVASVGIGAAAGYAQGGYAGMAAGAVGGYVKSTQKPGGVPNNVYAPPPPSAPTVGAYPPQRAPQRSPQIVIGPDGPVETWYDRDQAAKQQYQSQGYGYTQQGYGQQGYGFNMQDRPMNSGGFLQGDDWMYWAGGGALLLLVVYKMTNKKK
ncbi:MAG: hypothetical protein ACPGTP_03695 [Bacteroidia bacterium]